MSPARTEAAATGASDRTALKNVTAILSMLHEPAGRGSAARLFRGTPVLAWTLDRLSRAAGIESTVILCWDDQLPAVEPLLATRQASIVAKGPRHAIAPLDALTTARKWADGWRSGLLHTCDFDLGFHGPWSSAIAGQFDADAVVLIDPAAGLVDPQLLDRLVVHAAGHPDTELIFSPAAPGLGGVLLRRPLLQRLADAGVHPGKILHYLPDHPVHDPCSSEGCLPIAAPLARTLHRFKLDSDRQIQRIARATEALNGQLIVSHAEELVARMTAHEHPDDLPRELLLELTTARRTAPIFSPCNLAGVQRPDLTLELARPLLRQLAAADDARLTLAGVGDPLLSPAFFDILAAAAEAGIHAIHVETDLYALAPGSIERLAQSNLDIVSFHLPAVSIGVYEAIMGVNALAAVLENVKGFLLARQSAGRSAPLLVPIFTKCHQNFAEMEPWYDQWLRALGAAVIRGPSDCAGLLPDHAVADMAPPLRKPCARLAQRLTILSDGRAVACEEDVLGRQPLGQVGRDSLSSLWQALNPLRAVHAAAGWATHPLCKTCKQWHRP
jgi:hypothetical protein